MRMISKALYILLLAAFLVGCTISQPTQTVGSGTVTAVVTQKPTIVPATPTAEITVQASQLKGVYVLFMHPWTGTLGTEVTDLVDEFNRSNEWGIHVVVKAPGSASALVEELSTLAQDSTAPDLIAAPVDELLKLNKDSQTVADLTPYVNSNEWGLGDSLINSYLPVFWEQDDVESYRYGIPAQRNTKVMIYNKTWAKELGFSDAPVTPDDFLAQTCAATASMKLDSIRSNDGVGGWIVDYEAMTMASWNMAFGAQAETTGKISFNQARTVQMLTYLRNMLDKGCAWNSLKTEPYEYFATRQALVYSADLQDLLKQQAAQARAGSQDEWVVLPFPTTSDPSLLAEGPSYAIVAKTAEKKLAAWLFIRWMSSLDNQGRMVKVSATLPLGNEMLPYAIELQDSLPQWTAVINLLPSVQTTPVNVDWPEAKVIWEDASWQLFKADLKTDQIPDLVKQMDQTLKELTGVTQ